MSHHPLSTGSCVALQNATQGDSFIFDATHTLQILSIRLVNSNTVASNVDRYRIIVADGEHFIQAMLATQLNGLVQDNEIKKNTIVNITKMTCNFVQEKRLLIILALEVVEHRDQKIGDPQALGQADSSVSVTTTPAQSTSTRQPPAAPAAAPARQQNSASDANRGSIYPIEGLSLYQNNWTIKARVIQKSEMKTWSNQKGEGQLFNVTLMDDTGEIKATAFNQVAGDLFDRLQEGKVYYISKARVNYAKKQFSNLNNEYELALEKNTVIEDCLDTVNAPTIKYNFVALGDLEQINKDATCDVLAIVKEAGDLGDIVSKATQRKVTKRELTLVDKSAFAIRMTLWGKIAEQFSSAGQVIAFKNVKVGDFGGRSLSFFSSSSMAINPDIEPAHALRGWFDAEGKDASFQAPQFSGGGSVGGTGFQRSQILDFEEVMRLEYGQEGKPEYFSTRATIVFVKHESMWYPACQTPTCSKKVTDEGDGWRCEKCLKTWPKPKYRYIVAMACSDHTAQAWLQGFNDVGELIFGKPADDLVEMKEADDAEYMSFVQATTCESYNFLCRARHDDYNGQTRVRYGISRILPLNYQEEARYIRDQLLHSAWGKTAV